MSDKLHLTSGITELTTENNQIISNNQDLEANAKANSDITLEANALKSQETALINSQLSAQTPPATDKASQDEPHNSNFRWFVLRMGSGSEKDAIEQIKQMVAKAKIERLVGEVLFPAERVVKQRSGKKVVCEANLLQGYILINMLLSEETLHMLQQCDRVSLLLEGNKPRPLPEAEVKYLFDYMQAQKDMARYISSFATGDRVKICDGVYNSLIGIVEEVDEKRSKLKVVVSIFGRASTVELDFKQVEKEVINW